MENSAYAPNPLPPPALVVFSQAGGLPEALRMQRPFNPQTPEVKDLHIPFSTSGFGLRHMDGYPGLPAHLLHHLQPQFLHPALDPRLPFGSGAFRPLASSPVHEGKGFASAFAPPSKCLKVETSNGTHETTLFSPGAAAEERNYMNGQAQQRSDSSSPASVSISPPNLHQVVKEESSDAPMSEDRDGTATPGSVSEGTERSTPEEGRGFRRRKKLVQDPACCPVCGVTVRAGELESHFLQELDRLFKMSPAGRARRSHGPPHGPGPANTAPARPGNIGSTADGTAEGRWETYQRIKANRTSRLRIKNRKRKADEATCPVCNERFQGSVEELNLHVEHCLRKNGGVDEDENVDVEGDSETFEEYEWAGQKRIRASTLLQGGYAGAGMVTSSSRGGAEEDDSELVVDGDETATYGPSQYSEADVVPPSSEEPERDALREAVLSPDGRATPATPRTAGDVASSSTADDLKDDAKDKDGDEHMTPPAEGGAEGSAANPTLEALKRRIRELELESKAATVDKLKCLICMERYKKPAISICCWHVHCEQCWLHTLGAKKLCPQCNMITSPTDLRRIYL
ncbi:E3 ubiquitin-protein ligase Rnf220-like isoform X2 [Thrips palmi]|uniref:E3 ubiquitin-protein ligase Rnf220-like isoform X2 n=1 Tax=Thrips palmi TaxID=161013 RepID=A0A6P9A2S2_THRPL|nr:E3 ubiquitin-protein ligase Rnf220-like isoform X2 [Thrips palmi]